MALHSSTEGGLTPVDSQGGPGEKAQEPKGSLGSRAVSWISNKWSSASTLKKVGIVTTVALAIIGAIVLTHGGALAGLGLLAASGGVAAHMIATPQLHKLLDGGVEEDLSTKKANQSPKEERLFLAADQRVQLGRTTDSDTKYNELRQDQHNFHLAVADLSPRDKQLFSALIGDQPKNFKESNLTTVLTKEERTAYKDLRESGKTVNEALQLTLKNHEGGATLQKYNEFVKIKAKATAANKEIGTVKQQVTGILAAERAAIAKSSPPDAQERLDYLNKIETDTLRPSYSDTYIQHFGSPIDPDAFTTSYAEDQ